MSAMRTSLVLLAAALAFRVIRNAHAETPDPPRITIQVPLYMEILPDGRSRLHSVPFGPVDPIVARRPENFPSSIPVLSRLRSGELIAGVVLDDFDRHQRQLTLPLACVHEPDGTLTVAPGRDAIAMKGLPEVSEGLVVLPLGRLPVQSRDDFENTIHLPEIDVQDVKVVATVEELPLQPGWIEVTPAGDFALTTVRAIAVGDEPDSAPVVSRMADGSIRLGVRQPQLTANGAEEVRAPAAVVRKSDQEFEVTTCILSVRPFCAEPGAPARIGKGEPGLKEEADWEPHPLAGSVPIAQPREKAQSRGGVSTLDLLPAPPATSTATAT